MPVKFDLPDIHSSALTIASSQILHPGPDQDPIVQAAEAADYHPEIIVEPTVNSISDYDGLSGEQIKALLAANRPPGRHRSIASTTVSGAINGVCVVIYGTVCSILLCFEDAKTRYTELALFAAAILAILCPAAYSCCEVPRLRGLARRRAVIACRLIYTLAALASLAVIACAILSIVLESTRGGEVIDADSNELQETPVKIYLLLGTAIGAAILQILGGSLVAFMALVDNHR